MTKTENKAWASYVVETEFHSGEFVEVLELQVQDHGGNVLWSGVAGEQPEYRIPTRLVATKVGQPAVGGDVCCAYRV